MLSSKTTKELIQLTKNIIQPLLPTFYKGQAGRIVVIGGCEDYTGAPFFSAHSAALMGCDLSHIICERSAATVIKSYSADLMVHPYLYDSNSPEIVALLKTKKDEKSQDDPERHDIEIGKFIDEKIIPKVSTLLSRIHVVVAGPGFGRDDVMLATLTRIIEEVKVNKKPIILDADALYLISQKPELIKNYQYAILTPNVVEFQRLADKLKIKLKDDSEKGQIEATMAMSKALGGVTIIRKGVKDLIVKNDDYLLGDFEGSVRRVGGQGDTLTGTVATLLAWSKNYQNDLWKTAKPKLSEDETTLLSCFGGSTVTRLASRKAYKIYGRAMQASDVHKFIGEAYTEIFDTD